MATSLLEEVRREVARCVRDNSILRMSSAAQRVSQRIGADVPLTAIASLLLEAGIAAYVAVEIETPDPNATG